MHVLIIPSWYPRCPADIGGSFFREQALALSKNGCKVGVICPALRSIKKWRSLFFGESGISFENDGDVSTYRSHGVNWFPRAITLSSKLFSRHGLQLYDRYVAENGTPDVIHVHSLLYAGPVAVHIQKKYGVPFVVTEHSSAFARGLVPAVGIKIAKKVCSLASRKLAVSNAFASLLNKCFDEKPQCWEEMPNIVNDIFLAQKKILPKKTEDLFKFINIALMNKNKQQANLINAFAQICKLHPNVHLTLGGDGPERRHLEKIVANLGIEDKVKFVGLLSREQVVAEMKAADVFVLSSRYETFSVVIIEALALGMPVIATRCGGPESIIREEDGLLVPVDNVAALAVAMSQMLAKQSDYDSEEIRHACMARYSETAIATRLKKIYTEVVSTNSETEKSDQCAIKTAVDL